MADELEVKPAEETKEPDWTDPGAAEGVKKDPRQAQDAISADHPRFKEVYGKMKDFERQLEDIKKQKSDSDRMIDLMRKHNERLATAIENSGKPTEPVYDPQKELQTIDEQIKELRKSKKAAQNDLNWDAVEEFDAKIEDLLVKKFEVKAKPPKAEEKPKAATDDAAAEDAKAAVEEFGQIDWYQEDPLARGAAVQLDTILQNDPKWQAKTVRERLTEVRKRVEKRFGYANGKGSEPKPTYPAAAGVEAGNLGGPAGGGTTLSPEELECAKGLRITPEAYLKQKMAIGGGR